jgi:hypothetical protein
MKHRHQRCHMLSPTHPRWAEFLTRFGRLRSLGPGLAGTTRVLRAMQGIDIAGTLEALAHLGAYDDHDVLWNVLLR